MVVIAIAVAIITRTAKMVTHARNYHIYAWKVAVGILLHVLLQKIMVEIFVNTTKRMRMMRELASVVPV